MFASYKFMHTKLCCISLSKLPNLRHKLIFSPTLIYTHKYICPRFGLQNAYSGNKLSHLDGAILLQLPKLYSIQLGGSNEWRCDCRLRRLVRPLLNSNILQDEPRCRVQVQVEDEKAKEEISEPRREGRVWKNMGK